MTREKALEVSRLVLRIEELELQKDEISNLPVHLSERLSHKKNGYGIVYELAMEMFSQEDLDDLVAVIQIKLE